MAVKKSDKNQDIKKRDLKDHINQEATVTELDSSTVDIAGLGKKSDLQWKATEGEVHSDTKLEDDKGEGPAAVIRTFNFRANPEAFHSRTPSKQELFNAHAKQIEYFLYKDGLEVMYEVKPQLHLSKSRNGYRIIVAATPRKGFLLHERPQTLTEIVNEPRKN